MSIVNWKLKSLDRIEIKRTKPKSSVRSGRDLAEMSAKEVARRSRFSLSRWVVARILGRTSARRAISAHDTFRIEVTETSKRDKKSRKTLLRGENLLASSWWREKHSRADFCSLLTTVKSWCFTPNLVVNKRGNFLMRLQLFGSQQSSATDVQGVAGVSII